MRIKPVGLMLLLLPLLLVFSVSQSSDQCIWDGVGRIVAIGDVHGDYEQFVAILLAAELIDSDLNWIGGKTHLVQTGDVLDRGPDSRAVMDLIMSLEEQAPFDGGYVHMLLGNHEVMLMKTDLRYVHPGEILSYGGLKEMVRALRPAGFYGNWLSEHNTIIRINKTLFTHAGISGEYSNFLIPEINDIVRDEINRNWEEPSGILSSMGPVWFRGMANDRGSEIERVLEETLEINHAECIVIGHTVNIGGIVSRLSGRVVLIDTGMSECYGGMAQYLEIDHQGYKTHTLSDN